MGSFNNNRATVTIYGKTFGIVGDATSEEIKEYAEYVDAKIRELSGKSSRNLNVDIVVLAALNMAEEFFRIKAERDSAVEMIEEQNRANASWSEAEDLIGSSMDYESAREEILSLEKECERVRKEAEELKKKNLQLTEKIDELNAEIEKLNSRNIQMQLYIPDEQEE